jgi:acetyl-CoA acetyltransferase
MGFAIDRSRTIISAMILGRRMTAQDVAWLRREVFTGREVTREDADEFFAVARAEMDNAPEWKQLFVEVITEHVVQQAERKGCVSEERATWLLTRADECKTVEALATLASVVAEARSVPQWFLDAVRARTLGGWPSGSDALPAAILG